MNHSPFQALLQFFSSGTHSQMGEGKRLAIRVANFDALLTFLTIAFYAIPSVINEVSPLNWIQPLGLLMVTLGFFLIRYHHYDIGRYLIHSNGLVQIFITADSFTAGSGYEYYYITGLIIPFVSFSLEEHWKGLILSLATALFMSVQTYLGTGLILPSVAPGPEDRLVAIVVVCLYVIAILLVARFQLLKASNRLRLQQDELIHNANLTALGEMAGSMAHEINNPLQSLLLNMEIIKQEIEENDQGPVIQNQIAKMDHTIGRMAQMVSGLKDLSRDEANDPPQSFTVSYILDEVTRVSIQKIELLNIQFSVSGECSSLVRGHPVQYSQVLINLLNNSIEAIDGKTDARIWIAISADTKSVRLEVIDSGERIPQVIAEKMMKPFFTTKPPSKGTGLGLSISKSIMEKCGGSLEFDSSSRQTKFVMVMPRAQA